MLRHHTRFDINEAKKHCISCEQSHHHIWNIWKRKSGLWMMTVISILSTVLNLGLFLRQCYHMASEIFKYCLQNIMDYYYDTTGLKQQWWQLNFWMNYSFNVSNIKPTVWHYRYYAFKSIYTFMTNLVIILYCVHNFRHPLLYVGIF